MQALEIIAKMASEIRGQAAKLGHEVLHQKTAEAARRFIGFLGEVDPGIYIPKSEQLTAALDLVVADMEGAGLPVAQRKINYEFFRTFALSHGLGEKAEEYAGIIAGLNGVQHPDYQERGGLAIQI
mgnify:CR=1 FL=1